MSDEGDHNQSRREVVRALFERQPDAPAAALSPDGFVVPWPAGWPDRDGPLQQAQSLLDLVVPADHAEVARAWRAAHDMGEGETTAHLLGQPDRLVKVFFADLRHTDGVLIGMVTPVATDGDADHEPELLSDLRVSRPRHCTMRENEFAEVLDVSDTFEAMFGWSLDEARGGPVLNGVHPDDQAFAIDGWLQMQKHTTWYGGRWRSLHREGHWVWVDVTYQNHLDDPDDPHVIADVTDVTDEVAAQEALAAQELRLNRMAQVVPVGLFEVDRAGTVHYANDRVHEILGTGPTGNEDTLTGQLRTVEQSQRPAVLDAVQRVLNTGEDEDVEAEVRLPATGEPRRCLLAVRALTDRLDIVTGALVCVSDITETSRRLLHLERDLIHRSFHDELTGLPNRTMLISGVETAVANNRGAGSAVAVLLVDLDRFKEINDTLGHTVGDELLRTLSDRLRAIGRPGDLVARVGGDEFAIVLNGFLDPDHPRRTAELIQSACNQPFEVLGHTLLTGVSIGIATTTTAAGTEELLRDADLAMHRAKAAGRGRTETFEPEMHSAAVARVELEQSLRQGIEQGQLHLVYQPIHNLNNGTVTSVEALVRWMHPTRGLISPVDFIPLAEETGLIVPLGRWVLAEACAEAARWTRLYGEHAPRVSVNLSSRQLASPTVVDDVQAALQAAGLKPSQLVLEITESVLLDNSSLDFQRFMQVRELGVAMAIDDFGTGYSSLAYLEHLPVEILKIDKAFIDRIGEGGRHAKLIKGILGLSRDFGFTAVAEGIETAEQLRSLEEFQCPGGQGYLFSRPVDAADLRAYLHRAGTPEQPARPAPSAPIRALRSEASSSVTESAPLDATLPGH